MLIFYARRAAPHQALVDQSFGAFFLCFFCYFGLILVTLGRILEPKRCQNGDKLVPNGPKTAKTCRTQKVQLVSLHLLRKMADNGPSREAQNHQKWRKTYAKRHSNFASIFGTIFDGLFMDFGVIFRRFWEVKRSVKRTTNPGVF